MVSSPYTTLQNILGQAKYSLSLWVAHLRLEVLDILAIEVTKASAVSPLSVGVDIHLDDTVLAGSFNLVLFRTTSSVEDEEAAGRSIVIKAHTTRASSRSTHTGSSLSVLSCDRTYSWCFLSSSGFKLTLPGLYTPCTFPNPAAMEKLGVILEKAW